MNSQQESIKTCKRNRQKSNLDTETEIQKEGMAVENVASKSAKCRIIFNDLQDQANNNATNIAGCSKTDVSKARCRTRSQNVEKSTKIDLSQGRSRSKSSNVIIDGKVKWTKEFMEKVRHSNEKYKNKKAINGG